MAHLLPLLVLLFLAVHVSHGSPLPLTTYNDSMCLVESFRCGDVDIAYPFYLPNATRDYSCGYTDLKVFCEGEGKTIPILHLDGHSYTILNISYDDHTIDLVDTDVLRSNGCPRVSHGVSFGHEWLDYTEPFNSLTFFFDCYKPGDDMPHELQDYQITCKGFNSNRPPGSGDGVSFVLTSGSEERNVSQEHDLADHCKENFVVPVHEDVLLRSAHLILPTAYGDVLKRGFELEWSQSTAQPCHQCEQSRGRCAYSENKEFLGCLCSGGKVSVPDCNGSNATAASASPESSKFFRTAIFNSIPL
jgi:hypothetical protein